MTLAYCDLCVEVFGESSKRQKSRRTCALFSQRIPCLNPIILADGRHEADFLADRIGIIVQGHLRCVGTASDLKSRFGKGFKLSLGCPETSSMRIQIHKHTTKRDVSNM